MTLSTSIPLRSVDGETVGRMELACLPGRSAWNGLPAIVDRQNETGREEAAAAVQLLEEVEYSYQIKLRERAAIVGLEPQELFSPNNEDLSAGRFKAGRSTGTVRVTIARDRQEAAWCDVEIRSRKLHYESEYRWMLGRIAEVAAELVQAKFSANSLPNFEPRSERDALTLYQRFAFVQSILQSGALEEAFHFIRHRPHIEYRTLAVDVRPGHPMRSRPGLIRQLVAPGSRQPTAVAIGGLNTIPKQLTDETHIESYDTVPNRFVRFALTRWRDLASDVAAALSHDQPADQRGRREAQQLADALGSLLTTPAISEASELTSSPLANTVLQGRPGYREVLRAYLLAEAAASIAWEDGAALFRAGQRDVATLYEYWTFLELVRIVTSLEGFTADQADLGLVSLRGNRMSLDLRRRGCVARVSGRRRGQPVQVEVWFNRRFSHASTARRAGSWTEAMRPDCSVCIRPLGAAREERIETWVHFDAKYRVSRYGSDFSEADAESSVGPLDDGDAPDLRPVAADLMKMHAYRDAIRRTAGAYVLYPGEDNGPRPPRHRQYHEVVPGLGAFVLRPTDSGRASDAAAHELESFLEDVIDHVAAEGTSGARSRYWTDLSYGREDEQRLDFSSLLRKPADDTQVLLGFVKSPAHRSWILDSRMYNLRADAGRRGSVGLDSPEISADFVLLYDARSDDGLLLRTSGALYVRSARELIASGYPAPAGATYLCLGLDDADAHALEGAGRYRTLARQDLAPHLWGAPRCIRWSSIALGKSRALSRHVPPA